MALLSKQDRALIKSTHQVQRHIMGDRTHVTLIVPTELAEEAKAIIDATKVDAYQDEPYGSVTHFYFDEVNYGDLPFLGVLQDAGIPYNSEWESGDEYGPGKETLRFTPQGEAEVKEVYDADRNPDLDELLALLRQTPRPAQRQARLESYIRNHADKVISRSWDSQVVFGKMYRARQLLIPEESTTE